METETRRAVTRIFAEYYERTEFNIPGIEKREFGFGNVKKIDARHLAFSTNAEFRRYLATNTPLFVSHSTSYYEFPGATPMDKKQRIGADLVFDLDLHADGKYAVYTLLDRVKADLVRLVRDFILGDFGVPKSEMVVVFSGNRGYHVHVRDPRYLPLGSDERHELVDYVLGQGLNYMDFFPPDANTKKLLGPRPDEGGYRGRLARATVDLLKNDPTKLSRIFKDEKKRDFFIEGIREGNWSRTSLNLKDLQGRLAPLAASLPVSSVDTDAGVTQDLSKLIRVPNSIHGDTGFIAKILAVDAVEKFDPLMDAMIDMKNSLKVRFTEDVPELRIGGENRSFKKDELKELPRSVGLFYVCKGSAEIVF